MLNVVDITINALLLTCVTQRQMREYLIRLIYCEMLGIECSWGYIHAVKMTQSSNVMDKRIGE